MNLQNALFYLLNYTLVVFSMTSDFEISYNKKQGLLGTEKARSRVSRLDVVQLYLRNRGFEALRAASWTSADFGPALAEWGVEDAEAGGERSAMALKRRCQADFGGGGLIKRS